MATGTSRAASSPAGPRAPVAIHVTVRMDTVPGSIREGLVLTPAAEWDALGPAGQCERMAELAAAARDQMVTATAEPADPAGADDDLPRWEHLP